MRSIVLLATSLAVFRGCGDYTVHDASSLDGSKSAAIVSALNERLERAKEPNKNVGVCVSPVDLATPKLGTTLSHIGFAAHTSSWTFTRQGLAVSQDCENMTNKIGSRFFVVGTMRVRRLLSNQDVPHELGGVEDTVYKTEVSVKPSTAAGAALARSGALACYAVGGGNVTWQGDATTSTADFTVYTNDDTGESTRYSASCPQLRSRI